MDSTTKDMLIKTILGALITCIGVLGTVIVNKLNDDHNRVRDLSVRVSKIESNLINGSVLLNMLVDVETLKTKVTELQKKH